MRRQKRGQASQPPAQKCSMPQRGQAHLSSLYDVRWLRRIESLWAVWPCISQRGIPPAHVQHGGINSACSMSLVDHHCGLWLLELSYLKHVGAGGGGRTHMPVKGAGF